MLARSRAWTPDYTRRDDKVLRSHGTPDFMLVVRGRKLHVHSKILRVHTDAFTQAIANPDPYYGRQATLSSKPGRPPRTLASVVALLNAIYPPRVLPPLELLDEVHDIAKEYGMELLMNQLKIGMMKNCNLRTLELAEDAGIWPDLLLDVFAQFTAEQLEALPGFAGLQPDTKEKLKEWRSAREQERHTRETNADGRMCRTWPLERTKRAWLAAAAAPPGAGVEVFAGTATTRNASDASRSLCRSACAAAPGRPRSVPASSAKAAVARRARGPQPGGAGRRLMARR